MTAPDWRSPAGSPTTTCPPLGEAIAAQLPGGLAGLATSRSRKRGAAEERRRRAALARRLALTAAQAAR